MTKNKYVMTLPTSNSDHLVIQFSTSAPTSFKPFTRGWVNRYSKVIRILGHTYFSHTDFVLEDGNLLGASDVPASPLISGNARGVAIRPPEYMEFGIRRRMILKTDRANDILNFAHDQVGKPFDSGALTPKVFLSDPFYGAVEIRDWRDPNKWFCMELVICAEENGGYWGPGVKCPVMKNRITPADGYLIHMMDPNFINRDTFFNPLHDIKMGLHEK